MTLLNHWGKGKVESAEGEEGGGKEKRGELGGGRGKEEYHASQTSS